MNKHPLADCEKCPLQKQMYVPSAIPEGPTRLVVVGEAPGFHESVRKEPFKGPSGLLLDKVLGYHGFDRSEVLLTNVVSCRTEDGSTPPKEAILACRPRFLGEIQQHGSSTLVALGGTAVSECSDDPRSITVLRVGPPKAPSRRLRDVNVERFVATWHPAYTLRNADAFPTLVDDFGKVNRNDAGKWTPPNWQYYDEPPVAIDAIQALMKFQDTTGRYELVVDIEVGIEKDTSFDHPNKYQMLSVGLAWDKGVAAVIGEEALKDAEVRMVLDSLLRKSKLIAHNGKFDLAGLYPLFPKLELWFDTMLAHYVLDERPGGHGLKVLAVERLGAPQYDDEIKQYIPRGGNYANIPREILYKYNAYDVACTWDLYEMFVQDLGRPEGPWPYKDLPVRTLRDVHDFLVAASNQLMYLELNGIAIDRQYSDQLSIDYLEKLNKLEAELDKLVADATGNQTTFINPRSPKQLKEFFHGQGIRVESTNKDTLEFLLQHRAKEGTPLFEFLDTLLVHRYEQKRYGTFVKGIRQRLYRGRVYTNYLLHGTTSGRLASRDPNLQNIARDTIIRKQFSVSKPDNVLLQCDYKQAEGRVIAWLARDEYLRSIFADPNADLFDTLGAGLYRTNRKLTKDERVRVKAYFYGLAFGREAYSIAKEYGFSFAETERELQAFFGLIPDVARWQTEIKKKVLRGEDLVSPFGRRRRFALITDQNKKDVFNEALSYLPQSTASDVCLTALIRLRPLLRGLGFIRLTIHDALVVECHESRAEQVGAIMQRVMVDAGTELQTYVPFAVDLSVGKSWGEL